MTGCALQEVGLWLIPTVLAELCPVVDLQGQALCRSSLFDMFSFIAVVADTVWPVMHAQPLAATDSLESPLDTTKTVQHSMFQAPGRTAVIDLLQMFASSVFHYSRTCLPWEESCPSGVLSNQISAESRALLALCCFVFADWLYAECCASGGFNQCLWTAKNWNLSMYARSIMSRGQLAYLPVRRTVKVGG